MDIRANIEAGKYEAKISYDEDRSAHRASAREGYALFRADLAKAFEIPEGPIDKALWDRAWEVGHSSGFGSVLDEYDELVDLFIIIKANL